MTWKRRLRRAGLLPWGLGLISAYGCVASRAVILPDDVPLRLAEPVSAKVAYNAAPAGEAENWVVLPNRVTLAEGKYIITRRSGAGTTRSAGMGSSGE